ncbi:hypothetical protein SLEP1_g12574 [Rubroshorea leprosula]|uniref:Reverse transcriptase domain-containing protein n=1 Tax=Rubroshorea leprosula TaxID=152421 RepID=A0AAV5IMS0_9ROSI|nr:hypothetical protein SLEP1_g12574 [Rubroshorea leprosula]
MVNTRSVRAGNPSLPLGQGQLPNNLPPHLPPPIPNMFPHVDHVERGDENQPHNSAHNSTSTANQDVVAAQLVAMQQQFGVFQLVLAQLLARNNPAPAQQPLPDEVTRRLDSLEKLVAEQRGAPPPHHTADSIPHPLNTNITLEPYPASFKIPQLETYDRTKDPDDHLHAFYSYMQAQNASDALMCKIFPSTLRGNARTWYYSLPLRLISSYTEMVFAFATKFSNRRLIRKTTELMRVKQRDGESLKNYMSRFNDKVLEVSSFDQAMGIAVVISGLNHDRTQLPPRTKTQTREMRIRAGKREGWHRTEIKNKMDLRRPGPMRTAAASQDHTGYCDFHQNHGHTTEQCNSLRFELESLAQKGMLNEYIQRAEHPRFVREQRPQPQGVRNPPNRQGIIDRKMKPELLQLKMSKKCSLMIEIRAERCKLELDCMHPEEKAELIAFLRANNDVFAWTSVDMPGIPPSVSQHKLSSNPLKKPVAQKRRLFGEERLQVIKEEVEKLLQAGFVKKVDYCEWVANPMLVKKANGKWRMCIDYTNFNQACPKDCYLMPSIDKLVEVASGNERLSLLDAYSGYHQVPMAPEDEEKTLFYAGDEIYCYVMMPFGLKNAGATYQKMVTIVFQTQIGRNLEVYVDEIVVKSLKAEDHLADLNETFNNLKKNRMRLNPTKCIFGVEFGKFLGFMVFQRGI